MRKRIEQLGARLLPSYTDVSGIPRVLVPGPTLLDPAGTEDDWVAALGRAYRGTFEWGFGKRSIALTAPPRGKQRFQLVDFALALINTRIPPAAWCRFAFEVWAGTNAGGFPQVRWVYSQRLLVRRVSWYRQSEHAMTSHREVLVPAALDLHRDYHRMWDLLLRVAPTTRSQVAAVVDELFPDGAWEVRLVKARADQRELQALVRKLVDEGAVFW